MSRVPASCNVFRHAERRRPVPGQLVELHDRFLVEQLEDPLAGGLLALALLLVDGALVPGVDGRLQTALQVGVLARRGVDVDVQALVGRHLGALARRAGRSLSGPLSDACASLTRCNVVPMRDEAVVVDLKYRRSLVMTGTAPRAIRSQCDASCKCTTDLPRRTPRAH
jgi:hypothetical protein